MGRALLIDSAGERHSVGAHLEWLDDDGHWAGTLEAPLDWASLADHRLTLELPGNRWWDLPFVSPVEIDLLVGERAGVHGRVSIGVPAAEPTARARRFAAGDEAQESR